MCFSATISFLSVGVLATAGIFCMQKAFKARNHFLLALTPFLFALQQLLEGFVWIEYNQQNPVPMTIFSTAYLFFAFFFWIVWFPFVAYALESVKWKKILFIFLILFGFIFGLYLWLPILIGEGPRALIQTSVCGKSLCYDIDTGGLLPMPVREFIYVSLGLLYLLCSDVIFKRFWVVVMASAGITILIHVFAWTSVWCFFSALASLYIIYLITKAPPYSSI